MKKIKMTFLVVLMFTFGTSFGNTSFVGCLSYAAGATHMEQIVYGMMTLDEYEEALDWYYSECIAMGGQIEDPTFVK